MTPAHGHSHKGARRPSITGPLVILGGSALTVFFGLYLVDWYALARAGNPLAQLFAFDLETLQNTLGSMAQTVAAVLGIVITVVSIVVQLAATRYTPRIADMFFRDRTSIAVLSFFVVACINAVWVSIALANDFLPRISITFTMVLVTASLLMMVPYFAYVFDFLDPDRVVGRIQAEAVQAAVSGREQRRALTSIEQLSDIAVNAVSQKDKAIASGTVDALRDLVVAYLAKKRSIASGWFAVGTELRHNPDFVALAEDTVIEIGERRTWLEWKALRQYQTIYNEALGEMPELNHLIAINTRYIGETALANGDAHAVALAVKFFNTYLRATLNKQQIRTAYNILHQYRQLAERAVVEGQHALVGEVVFYLKYYAQIAHGMDLAFVTETVAYDIATLCERTFAAGSAAHERTLQTLLELDQGADTQTQERMLRGVRKAQAKLASFYLVAGEKGAEHARLIFHDMEKEKPERLASIRDELLRIESKDFWEVIDRGVNFDYIDAARKKQLRVFFSWFPSLAAPPQPASPSNENAV
jgi:hypothetical protein